MDISPNLEATLEKSAYAELLTEFEGKILPPHHPITHHVHRVVSDLLDASDLGSLHSTNPRKPPADDGFWPDDPFSVAPSRDQHASPDGGVKEWNLLVVDDRKIVNALAAYGMSCNGSPSHSLNTPFCRYHRCLHWDSTGLQE